MLQRGQTRRQHLPVPGDSSSPILTVDWQAEGEQWTVPLGAAIGHIFHLGRLPVNAQIGAYANVVKPDDAPDWQLRAQVQLMFPK